MGVDVGSKRISSGHIPVLLEEVVASLGETSQKTIIDGTFGAGGYSCAFLNAGATVIAIDRDPNAFKTGQNLAAENKNFKIFHTPFSGLEEVVQQAKLTRIDAIVFDFGVSSMQLDNAERGFAYQKNGPLDMRMDTTQGQTAADVLNSAREEEIADILYHYGEERKSRPLAKAIVGARKLKKFETTFDLMAVVEKVFPLHKGVRGRRHPAARTFQGLRIYVNRELEEIENVLPTAAALLADGGKLCAVSFHSLEDRIVKNQFKQLAAQGGYKILTKKPIPPTSAEIEANPRARSAKLRVLQKVVA